jgi:hypothetical protein
MRACEPGADATRKTQGKCIGLERRLLFEAVSAGIFSEF